MDPYTLEAGRTLDLLIAEYVMGWRWHIGPHRDYSGTPAPAWLLPPEMGVGDVGPGEWTWYADTYPHDATDGRVTLFDVPHYSTDMGAAWEVIEHFRDLWTAATEHVPGWQNEFERPFDDGAFFDIIHRHADRRWPWALLYVTPFAICRAALIVLGPKEAEDEP